MKVENKHWGVGLRANHFAQWSETDSVPVLEVMTDNLIFHRGGPALWHTKKITQRAPAILLHGIGLNIGGADPLSRKYLAGMRELIDEFKPRVVSDHLCFTHAGDQQSYELLPLVRTLESLHHVCERVDAVQQYLGCQLSLENVSAYISYADDSIPEGDFFNALAEKTGCGILLDINNVYVSAQNSQLDPMMELKRFNLSCITQIHVAGHTQKETYLFDTHDEPVCFEVWEMLKQTLHRLELNGNTEIPVILENDNKEIDLKTLIAELQQGQQLCTAQSFQINRDAFNSEVIDEKKER